MRKTFPAIPSRFGRRHPGRCGALLVLAIGFMLGMTVEAQLQFRFPFDNQSATQPSGETAVAAVLDPRRIVVGSQAVFTVVITNGRGENIPQVIGAPNLRIELVGHNPSIRIVNGVRTDRVEYIYSVKAQRAGRFMIPALEITANGKRFKTDPQELVVVEQSTDATGLPTNSPAFLQLELTKKELFAGEVVPLRLTLYVLGRNTISGVGQPEMERENLVMKRFPTSPRSDVTEINGRLYSTLTLETSLFGISPGELTVGPCSLPAMFYESQQSSRVPTIFRRPVRKTLESNAVQLTIKALPADGKPAGFTGAVGRFTLAHSASPVTLQVGDPISVDLQVSGIGNLDQLAAPELSDTEGWQLYPARELVQNLSDGVLAGKVTYSQVIIPQEVKTEIPPFRFSYFDPDTKEYVTVESDPIPIAVTPDDSRGSIATTTETPGEDFGRDPIGAQPPDEELEDLLYIQTTPPAFAVKATPLLRSPVFWAAQSIPAIALLGLVVFGLRRRWEDRAATRGDEDRPRACREILHDLKSGNLSRQTFYHDAVEFLDRRRESAPTGESASLTAEARGVEAAALTILYGTADTPPDASDSPISREERASVLRILEQLALPPES